MSEKDLLKDAQEQFEEAESDSAGNRAAWLEDMNFARLGKQWPDSVSRLREQENRPCLTINRLPTFIRQVVNDARQNKPSIKVHPIDDSADIKTAEIQSGLIKQIEASSNARVAYDTALDHAVSAGFGYFRVNIEYSHGDSFLQDLVIKPIYNPLTVYGDAMSMCVDAGDWRYAFVVDEIPTEQFELKYPKAAKADWSGGYAKGWLSEKGVRTAEWWTRKEVDVKLLKLSDETVMTEEAYLKPVDGFSPKMIFDSQGITVAGTRDAKTFKVVQRIITGAEVLETTEWAGQLIPICPVYGEIVIIEGVRHFISLTRPAKDPQRNFNYWRSAATELVALAPKAPFIGPKGAFNSSRSQWQTANIESHAFLEYDGAIPPARQAFAGIPAGALQEAMNASDDLKSVMGMYDASLGAKSNETSGRAIMARQREGDTSTFHFIDNLSRGIKYCGQVLVDLIPHVYNTPRLLRTIGKDDLPAAIQVNLNGIHDLTVGKYDVTVDVGPAFTTRREEAMNGMLEMIKVYPPAAPLLGDLLARSADWPNADEIAKRLKTMLPPQILEAEAKNIPPEAQALVNSMTMQMQQMQQALQVGQQQMQQMDMQAREALAKTQDELEKCQAALQKATSQAEQQKLVAQSRDLDKQIDQQKLQIDFYSEVTKRLQANLPVMPGAEGDDAMQAIAGQAEQQAQQLNADVAARAEQAAQLVVQAVQAMEQMVQRLEMPRTVKRDPNGLILTH